MNVWGKRAYSVAFPNDATFGTVTVNNQLNTNHIAAIGSGPLAIDGGSGGIEFTGPIDTDGVVNGLQNLHSNGGLSLVVAGTMTTNIGGDENTTTSGTVNESSSGSYNITSTAGDVNLISNTGGVLAQGQTVITLQNTSTANTITMDQLGDIQVVTHGILGIQSDNGMSLNGNPFFTRNYINTAQLTYTPCGPNLVQAIPDGGFFWDFPSGVSAGFETQVFVSGLYDGLASSPNQMEWQIRNGVAIIFGQFTNALASQLSPFPISYDAKFYIVVVSAGVSGVVRVKMECHTSAQGGEQPERYTQYVTDATMDTTSAVSLEFLYRTVNASANLSTLMASSNLV